MEKLQNNTNKERISLALGFFDCVHKAHREILLRCKSFAQKQNVKCAVFTFYDNIKPNSKQVYTFTEKSKILKDLGIDKIIALHFDDTTKNLTAQEFLSHLTNEYEIISIFCGNDYRFGKDRIGDTKYLKKFCHDNNIYLDIVGEITNNGERISSSLIKDLLLEGNIEKANFLLGDAYFFQGKVVQGRGDGKKIGIPTVNLEVNNDKFIPKNGVYATITEIDGNEYKSVTNVGAKPTLNDGTLSVETHISQFAQNVYGKQITVRFYKYLREIKKFANVDDLVNQVKNELKQWEEEC